MMLLTGSGRLVVLYASSWCAVVQHMLLDYYSAILELVLFAVDGGYPP